MLSIILQFQAKFPNKANVIKHYNLGIHVLSRYAVIAEEERTSEQFNNLNIVHEKMQAEEKHQTLWFY